MSAEESGTTTLLARWITALPDIMKKKKGGSPSSDQ